MSRTLKNLLRLCDEKGISVHQAAIRAGVSYSILNDLQSGKRTTLSHTIVCKLANFFECPVTDIEPEYEITIRNPMGSRIRQLRIQAGLSMEDLATMIDFPSATLAKLEQGGVRTIRPDLILSLAAALNTTPNELLGWNDRMPSRNSEKKILTRIPYLKDYDLIPDGANDQQGHTE